MRPKASELWKRIGKAGSAVELLLITRFYDELSRVMREEYGEGLPPREPSLDRLTKDGQEITPQPVALRVYRRFQEVVDTWPEQDLSDMLMIAAGVAPDRPRKVIERLGWGQEELALLNLTEDFEWIAEAEGTENGRLLVKLNRSLAHLEVRFPPSSEEGDEDDAA